jgi:hypothetical protein
MEVEGVKEVEVEKEVEEKVDVDVEVCRRRRRRRRGGMKGAPKNSCTNSYVVTTSTYLSPLS